VQAFIRPRAAGLDEPDPDGSVCQQRAGEVRANVVVEDRQSSSVALSTSFDGRVPVRRSVPVHRVARRVVHDAALTARSPCGRVRYNNEQSSIYSLKYCERDNTCGCDE